MMEGVLIAPEAYQRFFIVGEKRLVSLRDLLYTNKNINKKRYKQKRR